MSNKPRSSTAEVLLEVFGWGALIPQQEHQGPPALWCVVGFGQWEEPAEDGGWDGQRLGYLLPHQHPSLPLNPLHTPGAMPAACVPGPQMPHLVLLASLDSDRACVCSFFLKSPSAIQFDLSLGQCFLIGSPHYSLTLLSQDEFFPRYILHPSARQNHALTSSLFCCSVKLN